jgi:hypothetical protein
MNTARANAQERAVELQLPSVRNTTRIRASATRHTAALQAAEKLGSYYMFGCLKHRLQSPRGGVEEVTARAQPGFGEIFISRRWKSSRQIPADLAGIPEITTDFAETVCSLDTVSGIGTECTFVHGHL